MHPSGLASWLLGPLSIREGHATIRTTWTITHQRPLEPDEDPLAVIEHADPELLLWAIEQGQVTTTVEILEQQ